MAQAVEDWYRQMPIITRSYVTAAVVTTIGCSLDVCLPACLLSPFLLFLNFVFVFFFFFLCVF
jgi:hypothetical protein